MLKRAPRSRISRADGIHHGQDCTNRPLPRLCTLNEEPQRSQKPAFGLDD